MLCLAGPASSSSAAVAGGLSTSVALAVPQRQRASVPRCSATHALPLLVLLVDHHTARHPSAARRPTVPPPMARASTAAAAAMSAWQPPSAAAPTTPRKLSLGTGGTTDILPSDLLWSASVSHGDLLGCVRSVLLAMHERHANIFELLAAINSFLQHGTTKAEHVVAWVRRPRRSHRSLRTPLPLSPHSRCAHTIGAHEDSSKTTSTTRWCHVSTSCSRCSAWSAAASSAIVAPAHRAKGTSTTLFCCCR